MSNELLDKICKEVNTLNNKLETSTLSEEENNIIVTRVSRMCDAIDKLGNTSFKSRILNECKEYFYVDYKSFTKIK